MPSIPYQENDRGDNVSAALTPPMTEEERTDALLPASMRSLPLPEALRREVVEEFVEGVGVVLHRVELALFTGPSASRPPSATEIGYNALALGAYFGVGPLAGVEFSKELKSAGYTPAAYRSAAARIRNIFREK